MKRYKLNELARIVQGEIQGEPELEIAGLADLRRAGPHDLAFAMDRVWLERIAESPARAVVVSRQAEGLPPGRSYLKVQHPRQAMVQLLHAFDPGLAPPPGIHPLAAVSPAATIGPDASVGPFVTVEDGASVGARAILQPGVYVGAGASIGDDTTLYANVSVREGCVIGRECIVHCGAVIGSDGYGFVQVDSKHVKIPQIGIVRVGDRVEIGANTTIDRATMGETVIGSGTKIDNLVQIAHNVETGEDCLLVAQVGIAGSTSLGHRVTMAGQSAIGGHLTVGNDVVVTGQSGVTKSVAAGKVMGGSPARLHRENLQMQAQYQRLPRLVTEVRDLRRRLAELEGRLHDPASPTEQWDLAANRDNSG